jgi:hypothetical protein
MKVFSYPARAHIVLHYDDPDGSVEHQLCASARRAGIQIHPTEASREVLDYRDVNVPKVGPEQVLVAVEAIAIECADLIDRRNNTPPRPLSSGMRRSWKRGGRRSAVKDRH